MASDPFQMRVKLTPSEKEFEITVTKSIKLAEVKELCCKELGEQIAMRLVYRGKILKDTDDLSIFQPNTCLFLVKEIKKAPEAPSSTPQASTGAPPMAGSPNPFAAPSSGQNPGGLPFMSSNPFAQPPGANPYAQMPGANPFMQMPGANPFMQPPPASGLNPGMNPFMQQPGGNPFMQPQGGNPFGGMMDPSAMSMMNMMMSDPNMREQMMRNMQMIFSNPQMREMVFNSNPMLRNMMQQNPEIAEMFSNPQMLEGITRMMAGGQGANPMASLGGMLGGAGGNQMGGFPGMMPNNLASNVPQSNLAVQNPRELYSAQLEQMKDMGFFDEEKNIQALQATQGNVNAAIEKLLS